MQDTEVEGNVEAPNNVEALMNDATRANALIWGLMNACQALSGALGAGLASGGAAHGPMRDIVDGILREGAIEALHRHTTYLMCRRLQCALCRNDAWLTRVCDCLKHAPAKLSV